MIRSLIFGLILGPTQRHTTVNHNGVIRSEYR